VKKEVIRMAGRSVKVSLKLAPSIKNELAKTADEMGLTMASLIAHILGEWVYSRKKFVQPAGEKIGLMLANVLKSAIEEREMKP